MAKKCDNKAKKDTKVKKERKFPTPPNTFAGFFGVRPRSGRFLKAGQPTDIEQLCDALSNLANKQIAEECGTKEFTVESLFRPCGGGDGGGPKQVDLVVVIDTSGSMGDEANDLSNAASEAINLAAQSCPSDLRVAWFGIEGTFPATNFDTKLRDYLLGIGIADSDIRHRKEADIGHDAREDGGRAIEDISDRFVWRPGAKRVIFFLGDEPLEGGEPQDAADKVAADNAIKVAQNAQVTVYTYAGSGIENYEGPDADGITRKAVDEYERVATETGGIAYSYTGGDINNFKQVLVEIICTSSGAACGPVRLPEIRPCFTLRWGDGSRDNIETHDTEVICLTASNPYTNVTLKDVTAYLIIVNGAGAPPEKLPDGTDSIRVKPSLSICFGDLEPCSLGQHEKPKNGPCNPGGLSSISRELVLLSRNAKEGPYYIFVAYCYKAEFSLAFGSVFPIELVKS